ncbi:MAG: medium chain dehydrogenase/reductase family protein [Planctomycetota bacterium]
MEIDTDTIVITRHGGPEVLRLVKDRLRDPGRGEVRVAARAVGLNFADVFCRLGLYDAAPRPPFVPGLELSGVIESVGDDVKNLSPGQRVAGVMPFGAYATHAILDARHVRPLPDSWSYEQGAAFLVTYLTAHYALHAQGGVREGQTVLIHSAAGGVGTAAVQLARIAGARVIAIVGSAAKVSVVVALGVKDIIDASQKDFASEVRRMTGGEGVDIVLDAVGGRSLRAGYQLLRAGGRLIVYGAAAMMPRGTRPNWIKLAWQWLRTPRFFPLDLMARNRGVLGFNLIHLWDRPDLLGPPLTELEQLAHEGHITPVVGSLYPFEQAAAAQEALRQRTTTGKVVLLITP